MDTAPPAAARAGTNKKKPRFHAACWNILDT